MISFRYTGMSAGSKTSGTIQAPSRKDATRQLRRQNIQPIRIEESKGSFTAPISPKAKAKSKPKAQATPRQSSKITAQDAKGLPASTAIGMSFLSKLLDLNGSGMPVGDSIKLMRQRVSNPVLQQMAELVWRDLSEGLTLAEALSKMPKCFNPASLRLLEAGETTGNLTPVLQNIVDYLEEKEAIRKKILSGLSYPIFVCGLTLLVAIGFLFFLLPQIKDMIESLGGEMNLITRILIGGGEWGITFGPFVLIGLVLIAVSLWRWSKTGSGKIATDQWILRIPMLGAIHQKAELYQCTNLLATLFESNITTTESLRLTEKTIGNSLLQGQFSQARQEINEGQSFSQAFANHDFFPELSLDIITIGESTGHLAKSLRDINRRFREELTALLSKLTVLITTIALTSAFILVGMTAVGMVMSIFQVSQSLQLQ